MTLNGKPVSASVIETNELVQPFHVNVYGSLFGGHLMELVDTTAGIAAYRHSGMKVVTISVDQLTFKAPAPVGSILKVKACVTRVFNTSMEVGVKVTAWMPGSSQETLICPAYLTFVALGHDNEPAPIPPVLPETSEERRQYEAAGIRRESRLELSLKLKQHREQ